jgi:hypothetical protein
LLTCQLDHSQAEQVAAVLAVAMRLGISEQTELRILAVAVVEEKVTAALVLSFLSFQIL